MVAALSSFLLGGLWYGPLFKSTWGRDADVDPKFAPRLPARVFGSAFALALMAAIAFACLLGLHRC